MCRSMLRKRSVVVQFVFIFALGLTILVDSCSCDASGPTTGSGWAQLPTILSRIVPPTFRDEDFVITDYGAVGDGVTDCNPAFKKAIAACTKAGGGRVVVPKGTFLTNGPIHLDNNVNLHVTKGATILFGTKFDDYLPHVLVRWAGTECYSYSPLIYAYKKTNIAVTGPGTLDGQAKSSWVTWGGKNKPGTPNNKTLRKMGADGVPVEKRKFYMKPSFILPFECKNVLIEGVTLKDYPFWCVHLTYCTNATVRNVRVDSWNPNNDGCDADSCTDVLIENCGFNTRDDSICIKSGRDQDGWRVGKPSQNIIIRNMTDWHGLAIGSEMSGGVKNVFLENCSMENGDALYLKSNLDRGGFIEDIWVRNLKIGKTGHVVRMRHNYHGYRGGNSPAIFRNIHIEDVTVKEASGSAVSITGVKGANNIRDVFLKNVTIDKGAIPTTEIQYADNVELTNVYVNGKLQPTHPKLLPPEEKEPKGTASISPMRSGLWSDASLWEVGRDGARINWGGAPAGRRPDDTKDKRVLIGKKSIVPAGVTVILDMDIENEFEVRVYENSALIIPSGRTLKIGRFRPDRNNSMVRQTGGTVICTQLCIDDVTCQYLITGGSISTGALILDEGMFIIDDSAAAITSISVEGVFQALVDTTTKFIAHSSGVTPIQCKDVQLDSYYGEYLIVDVTKYDYAKNGDLVLFSYTGTRTGKFDGGPENPTPQVTIIGADADVVYDDAGKKIKLSNLRPVPFVKETPAMPKNVPADWLTYHLAHPGPGVGMPGDPNPAFFYKGRYHLHYIYKNRNGCAFAHVSSKDMVTWKWHPTVLAKPTTGHGMYSGTGFFTKDGQPAMIYHGQGSGNNHLAFALDDNLDEWTKPVAVKPMTKSGEAVKIRMWDPDCWLNGDTYYAISGGRPPHLMKSSNLKEWEYLGLLLHEDMPDLGVSKNEDVSCANMFKIGNKWMLLCISHKLGCRYYLGDFKDEKYLPEFHAMMNWRDWDFFAPESLLTPDGRRVMWAWCHVKAANSRQTAIQSLPRELSLPADGVLRIKPLRELKKLRYARKNEGNIIVKSNSSRMLKKISGDTIELSVTIKPTSAKEYGVSVFCDKDGKGFPIAVKPESKVLAMGEIKPPFELKKGEDLNLRIFLDKGMVEVFVNDRQAAVYMHQHDKENVGISLFSKGGDITAKVKGWKMKSIYAGW